MRLQIKSQRKYTVFENTPKITQISVKEIIWLFLLVTVVLLINLVTSARFPAVWLDEVMLTDPGANLYFGHGFTSSAWPLQTKEQYWAGNAPLYSFLLYFWLQLVGFSLAAIRDFNYVFMVAAVIMIWLGVIRLKLVNSPESRVILIAFLLLSYAISLNFHQARYDSLNIFLVATAFLLYSIEFIWLRCILLLVIGIFFTLSGLHLIPYTFVLGGLLIIFIPNLFFRDFFSLVFGLIIGSAFLYFLYSTNGVWADFIASIQSMKAMPYTRLPKDPSLALLFVSALAIAVHQTTVGKFQIRSPLSFGIAVTIVFPIVMRILGRFPTYYAWMAFIPLAICVCSAISQLRFQLKRPIHSLILSTLLLTCLVGWPLQMVSTAYLWNDRNYAAVEDLAARNITKTDWVYCDYSAYYAVKPKAEFVALEYYLNIISPEEKEKISALIIPPYYLDKVTKALGGKWYSTGDSIVPSEKSFLFFKKDFGDKLLEKYHLEVFRRQVGS